MWPFKRKAERPAPPAPVTEIIVPQGAVDAEEAYALPCAVVDYVNHLMHAACYQRDELPIEALWSYHVDYYLAQVNNGGHGQFVANSGWLEATRADIAAGLSAMGQAEAAAIFAELERFAIEQPERFAETAEGGGFGEADPVVAALDERFFAGPSRTIAAANGAWLRRLPHLHAVADRDHRAALDALAQRNTAADARRAERERLSREWQARDPLTQTFVYLLGKARPPLAYQGWNAGYPQRRDDGTIIHVFGVNTDAGLVHAVLSRDTVALARDLAAGAIVTLATAKLDRHLRKKTGRVLADVLDL